MQGRLSEDEGAGIGSDGKMVLKRLFEATENKPNHSSYLRCQFILDRIKFDNDIGSCYRIKCGSIYDSHANVEFCCENF